MKLSSASRKVIYRQVGPWIQIYVLVLEHGSLSLLLQVWGPIIYKIEFQFPMVWPLDDFQRPLETVMALGLCVKWPLYIINVAQTKSKGWNCLEITWSWSNKNLLKLDLWNSTNVSESPCPMNSQHLYDYVWGQHSWQMLRVHVTWQPYKFKKRFRSAHLRPAE